MTIEQMWDYLIEQDIATEDELQLVTNGWGYSKDTLETVLYVRTGYSSFEQYDDETGEVGQ